MFVIQRVVLLAFWGCSRPETEAGQVALKYVSLSPNDYSGRHAVACPDDRDAKSVDDLAEEYKTATGGMFGGLVDQLYSDVVKSSASATRTVKTSVLNAEKNSGSVTIAVAMPAKNGAPIESVVTLAVKIEGDGWCVVTGWAEQKRLAAIVSEAEAITTTILPLVLDWKFDEAQIAVSAARITVSQLPASHPQLAMLTSAIDRKESMLVDLKTGWVGGRWRVKDEKDPMTDDHNIIVSLRSVGGIPNVLGSDKPVTFIFRCVRGELDAYVATSSMLDSDWRTDSLSGQHRFGSDKAERFWGDVSTDREAVFLKQPREWVSKVVAREAEGWTVELPIYNRTPASVYFDLTGAAKAISAIPDDCK